MKWLQTYFNNINWPIYYISLFYLRDNKQQQKNENQEVKFMIREHFFKYLRNKNLNLISKMVQLKKI
jgi:hypothetical protein